MTALLANAISGRWQQAAVGIVIGEDFSFAAQLLDRSKNSLSAPGLRRRGFPTGCDEHLRENGTAEPVLAAAEVDEDEMGVRIVEGGRQGAADVGDGGEGGDDERKRSDDAFLVGAVAPARAHAHRVLADGNRDAERGTEFHADGVDGGEEFRAVPGAGGGHPVGGELDVESLPICARRDW